MFAQFWRKRVQLPPAIRSGAPTRPDLAPNTTQRLTAAGMAGVQDPIVYSLTIALHGALCGATDPPMRVCPRFAVGSAHYDYYELRAEILLEKLGPMCGRGNVQWIVLEVINEVLLCSRAKTVKTVLA